jgi:hypothetical protein
MAVRLTQAVEGAGPGCEVLPAPDVLHQWNQHLQAQRVQAGRHGYLRGETQPWGVRVQFSLLSLQPLTTD